MIKKETLTKIAKNAGELKDQAAKLGQEAIRTSGNVKQALQTATAVSKTAFGTARKVVNARNLGQGIQAASKGVAMASKGAQIASQGTKTLAATLEKASSGMKKLGNKLKNR